MGLRQRIRETLRFCVMLILLFVLLLQCCVGYPGSHGLHIHLRIRLSTFTEWLANILNGLYGIYRSSWEESAPKQH